MPRKLLLTLTCGLVTIGCIGVLAGQANAAPVRTAASQPQPDGPVPGGFASWAALYAMQHQLDVAATKIAAADGAGRAGIEVSAVDRELSVYWPGTVPATVRALTDRLGVHVSFHQAAFSQRTLVTAAQQLAATPGVAEAAPKADGSGLTVRVTSAAAAKTVTSAAAAETVTGVSASRIPLTITIGQRPQATLSRTTPTPPFYGGSQYYNSSVGYCTNGFAISPGSNGFGTQMLSAGHCGSNGDSVTAGIWNGGTIANKAVCRDTLEINNYPVGTAPDIYTGGYSSGTYTNVFGSTPDFVGDRIETGGSFSGEHDYIPVIAVDVFASVTGIPCSSSVGPLDEASYGDGTSCAVAPGDSGGPVYSFFGSSSSSSVLARGTITGGNTSVSCPGLSSSGFNTVFYAPLVRPPYDPQIGTLQYYGASLVTSTS